MFLPGLLEGIFKGNIEVLDNNTKAINRLSRIHTTDSSSLTRILKVTPRSEFRGSHKNHVVNDQIETPIELW